MICTGNLLQHFYPRSPCGERRNPARRPTGRRRRFLSTLSLRRATAIGRRDRAGRDISIHALLAESDQAAGLRHHRNGISIHALLAESDSLLNNCYHNGLYFYPRSPCGERPDGRYGTSTGALFLSTLSLRRATPAVIKNRTAFSVFLSTLSLRRATSALLACRPGHRISIHALLAESDKYLTGGKIQHPDFYPRSPCGERPTKTR